MAKLRKDKIALFLACASILGGKAQAVQNINTGQTVAAVGGATLKNNKNNLSAMDKSKSATDLSGRKIENKSFINKAVDWIKAKPGKAAAIGAGVITAATAAVALPILLCKSKNSKPPQVIKDKGNNPKKDLKKNEIENQKEFQGENKGNLGEKPKEKPEEKPGENPGENPRENPGENLVKNPGGNLEEKKEEVKVEKKKEEKKEKKKEEKKEENKIISNVNTGNANYQKFEWNKVKFSSNDGYAAKTATIIDDDKYLKFLNETYDIKENFTAGKVNNIYDGYFNKANLIVVDCNCTEFCEGEVGTVNGKDGTIAYCNGHGQIFILQNTNGGFLSYGKKDEEGKWTLEKQGEDGYYVNWHTS